MKRWRLSFPVTAHDADAYERDVRDGCAESFAMRKDVVVYVEAETHHDAVDRLGEYLTHVLAHRPGSAQAD